MAYNNSVRDSYIHDLNAWRTISSNSPVRGGQQPYNIGTEFSGADAPKLKFLFTISFQLGEALSRSNSGREFVSTGSDSLSTNTYDCKTVSRPNISSTLTEVNSYNYRFKVPTRNTMGTLTVSFYDDNKNTAHKLLQEYLNRISPITNKNRDEYFADGNVHEWSSMGGMIDEDLRGLIRSIRVTHHYNKNYTASQSDYARVYYDYMNPQLQEFVWEDLDMSQSDASMITATFVYDSVNITVDDGTNLQNQEVSVGNAEPIYD